MNLYVWDAYDETLMVLAETLEAARAMMAELMDKYTAWDAEVKAWRKEMTRRYGEVGWKWPTKDKDLPYPEPPNGPRLGPNFLIEDPEEVIDCSEPGIVGLYR